jgi:hypothetical protein
MRSDEHYQVRDMAAALRGINKAKPDSFEVEFMTDKWNEFCETNDLPEHKVEP